MKKYSVFCYGEIGVDNIIEAEQLPTPEIAVFPKSESYHVGGAAANTAIWLAKIGLDVGLSGNAIGIDQYGELLLRRLKEHTKLDLERVEIRKDIPTPFTRAIVTPDGERSFLIFYYPQTPKVPFVLEQLRGAQYLALDLYGGPERLEAAKLGHNKGIKTVIGDVVWKDHAVLPFTSIATNSGSYIRNLFPGVNIRNYAHELQSISKGIIITTDGGNKVHVIDEDGSEFFVQPPKVKVVDATGAGDAFRSGLLYGLVQEKSLADSVCLGVAAGSLKVGHFGAATTVPTLGEILEIASEIKAEVA